MALMARLGGLHRRTAPILSIALILLVAALIYDRLDVLRKNEPELVEAQILGFHGYLDEGHMRNVVLGRVRLEDGAVRQVRWPDRGASGCRAGDTVQLARRGFHLSVVPSACERRPESPAVRS